MIVLGKSCYFKFNVGQLDTDEDISIWLQPANYKYRINGGLWNVDSTSGTLASFGISNNKVYIKKKDNTFLYYTSNETIEIWCENVYAVYPRGVESSDNYKILNRQSISEPIHIELSNLTCERELVGKGSYLDNTEIFYGQFTEEFDILNPSLLIQYDGIFEFNYVSISILHRKYFINKITNVRKDLWRIDCHVDVLYTYGQDERNGDLYAQTAFIERNERNPYNLKLADDRWTFTNKPTFTFTDVTGRTLANTTLDVNLTAQDLCMCFSVLNEETRTDYDNITSLITGLGDISAKHYQNAMAYNYVLTPSDWTSIAKKISETQALATFIFGAILYPFNFYRSGYPLYDTNQLYPLKIGSTDMNMNVFKMKYDLSPQLIIADFNLPSFNNFRDIEPYKQCQLYIPFYNNLFTFNLRKCAGDRIIVFYTTQFSTGDSDVHIYDYTKGQMLLTAPVELAQRLAVSTTNLQEITYQRKQTAIAGINNTLDSFTKMIFSGASGNLLGGIKGVQQFGKGIVDLAMSEDILQDTANVQIPSSIDGIYNPMNVILITKTMQSIVNDIQAYYGKNGYPIQCWDILDDEHGNEYTGYTELSQIHYTPFNQKYITTTEIEEIERLAKNGIIL